MNPLPIDMDGKFENDQADETCISPTFFEEKLPVKIKSKGRNKYRPGLGKVSLMNVVDSNK